MARPLRLEFPGAIYHITSRGNARENIYVNNADRKKFLSILGDTVDRYNWICHAYCLMNNHYHLLIETIDPNLSMGMRQLNGVYTQSFNRSHKRVGHLFQGRYKSILVERGPHLLELCRYIILNPVKARMVEQPEQYKWSSYKATIARKKSDNFLTSDWILGQFSNKKAEAQKRYRAFVRDGVTAKSPWRQLQSQIFFGSKEFIARMRNLIEDKKEINEIPREQRYPGRPSLKDLFHDISNKNERNKKMIIAHLHHGYPLNQIAEASGVHYTTVSRAIKRTRQKI